MSIIDSLSPMKKKFFESIGIYSDRDIPPTFFEKIKSLNEDFSESEKFCISDYNVCYYSQMPFNIRDLVGTDHDRYAGKSWLEAFLDLARGDENIELYFENPDYYSELQGRSDLGLARKDGKFYILGVAGGGNNRLILMKIKYLALASRIKENENIDEMMNFYANVRQVPSKKTADSIFYLVFPDGSFCESGYYVINKSNNPNLELYDIVTGYPVDTNVVVSNIKGSEIATTKLDVKHTKLKWQFFEK